MEDGLNAEELTFSFYRPPLQITFNCDSSSHPVAPECHVSKC